MNGEENKYKKLWSGEKKLPNNTAETDSWAVKATNIQIPWNQYGAVQNVTHSTKKTVSRAFALRRIAATSLLFPIALYAGFDLFSLGCFVFLVHMKNETTGSRRACIM